MSITMQQLDTCIDTTINRLSSESGRMQNSAIMYIRFLGYRAFRTIFAKQSLVSTLLMKWPARGHRF